MRDGPGADRDTVIDSILDWRDSNRDHRLNGAEEDYYRGLDPPYSCKDGPFDVVEELLLVRGVTPELFAGGEVGRARAARAARPAHARTPDVSTPATAPQAVLEACGASARAARPIAPTSRHFVIVATGKPGGGGAAALAARRRAAGGRG